MLAALLDTTLQHPVPRALKVGSNYLFGRALICTRSGHFPTSASTHRGNKKGDLILLSGLGVARGCWLCYSIRSGNIRYVAVFSSSSLSLWARQFGYTGLCLFVAVLLIYIYTYICITLHCPEIFFGCRGRDSSCFWPRPPTTPLSGATYTLRCNPKPLNPEPRT